MENNQELQHQERGGAPGLDPNPIAWGRVNKLILNQEVCWKPQSLQQLSNPANCCLRLRFIRVVSTYVKRLDSVKWCEMLLGRVKYCMAWWDSIDRRERYLLYLLLIFYISFLLVLFKLFIGIPIIILILVFDFYGLSWFPIAVLLVLIVSMELFRRTLLQCDRLYCFLVGRPFYYIMVLSGVMLGLVGALSVAIASYLILSLVFRFEVYASLLLSLMLAIPTFALATLVYFRKPWYMLPLLLPPLAPLLLLSFAIDYFSTGVTNPFQWYLRKREELLARGVCKLNDGA